MMMVVVVVVPSSESNGYYMPPRYENDNGACKLRITAPCKLGGGRGEGTWKCRVSKYQVLFLFIRWRDAKSLDLFLPSPTFFEAESFTNPSLLLSNNEIYVFFCFQQPFPCWPTPCTKKQKEIFKGIRARAFVRSFILLPRYLRKIFCKHLPGNKSCFVDASSSSSSFTRNVQSWYAARSF